MGVVAMAPLMRVFLLALISSSPALGEDSGKKRTKKLFYVSTTSSTTTLRTDTICYASTTTTLGTCGRRKRRSFGDISSYDSDQEKIHPTGLSFSDKPTEDIEDSKEHVMSRKPRFLVYWMTTTSLSTLTSYTTTLTVASLTCTPSA